MAFLYGDIKETVYVEQPSGFSDGTKRVCKLNKALYGTKQASRNWQHTLHASLIKFGFEQCKSDECLYVLHHKTGVLYMVVYVDDIVLAFEMRLRAS